MSEPPVRRIARTTANAGPEVAVRGCQSCGRPLSRYNNADFCAGCTAGSRSESVVRAGDIGARLRTLRRQRGMSLSVLGGLCGVSAAYLSMIENGKRHLDRWSTILALADALRIHPADLALDTKRGRTWSAGADASEGLH